MKKIITAFGLLSFLVVNAQEEVWKAERKSISAELNIIPFSTQPINMPYLRARYFIKDRQAVRIGFTVNGRTERPDKNSEGKMFTYNLRPGYEYHFKGSRRISPYIGAEIDFAKKNSKYSSTQSGFVHIDGAISPTGDELAFTRLGANALAGADIYILKRLYVGFELGFGWTKTNFSDVTVTQNGATTNYDGSKTSTFGPTFNRAFRFGFFFN